MIYAIIILSLITVILFILSISKPSGYDIFATINDSDLNANAKNLALSLRMPESVGASPKMGSMTSNIKSAYKMVQHKVNVGEDLYEFERWLYENYFTIKSIIDKNVYKNFALLPHKYKEVRVITIAKFLVRASLGEVTENLIDKVITTFNTHTPLHNEEIFALKDAINYAIIFEISKIAEKTHKFVYMKERAENGKKLSKKLSVNDSYLYWYKKSGRAFSESEILAKGDINIENIEYSFSTTLIDNAIIMKNCIQSLKKIKDIFNENTYLKYSYANTLMSTDETYTIMDNESKIYYLHAVEKLSNLFNITEKTLIETAMLLAKENNIHFGLMLFEHKLFIKAYLFSKKAKKIKIKGSKTLQRLYSIAIYTLNTILSIVIALFFANSIAEGVLMFILTALALFASTEFIVNKAHKLVLNKRPIAKLNHTEVPDNAKTLVVVPHFIADEQGLNSAINDLLVLRAGNCGKNIEFSLLIDYKPAKNQIMAEDLHLNAIITDKLSDFRDINVFVRRRKKVKDKYCGFERKRGAIMALNEMLLSKDINEFSFVLKNDIVRPEFVIVLDSDNKLFPNTVLNAVNTIMHPLNAEYDLLAFKASYNLYTMNTLFAKQYYFESGYERYNEYSNYYYDMCKRSIFCGKGIYRLSSFYTKLKNVLPDGKVLSHDIIEGAILNTGALNETVFEEVPNSLTSETNRRSRWMRGDLQLTSFLANTIKNNKKQKIKVDKQPIYNYIISSNSIKAWEKPAQLALLLIPLFTLNIFHAIPFLFSFLISPFLNILNIVNGINKDVRYRYVLRGIGIILLRLLYDFISLPFYGVNSFFTIIGTYFRMWFLKSKLLDWTPFAISQRSNGVLQYLTMLTPSFFVMTIIGFIGFGNLWLLGYIAIFNATMIVLYGMGKMIDYAHTFGLTEANQLSLYARKTYEYFTNCKNNNHLICDNYQVKPYKGKSTSTSPTNIGFSLIAEVSACELDIIDKFKAGENILNILKTVQSLKKYKGNLYNWYDINTKQVLAPNYVSSVDSGNFIASLIATKEFLIKNSLSGVDLCIKLIENTDFTFLFDDIKQLFFIGYNTATKEYGGHYDILASESRILNYIYSCLHKKINSYSKLSRDITSQKGGTLLSWSGTMFEYLMPRIFIKDGVESLIDYSNDNIVKIQRKNKCNGLWGISESGYYKYDDNLNYQYLAFGISDISMRSKANKCVISPYSTFLALHYDVANAIKNLNNLVSQDMFGEYGFYEAIDFSSNKNIIYSYMAHHQGMILASIANALKNDTIVNYFMSDKVMNSGQMLLTERRKLQRAKRKPKEDFVYDKYISQDKYDISVEPSATPCVNILTNGKYSVIIDEFGNGYSVDNGTYINKYSYNSDAKEGIFTIFKDYESGDKFSPTFAPCYTDQTMFSGIFNLDECVFINSAKNIKQNVYVPHCINGEVRKYTILNSENKRKNYKFNLYMDLCLNTFDANISHPAFSDLFISTTVDNDKNAIIAHRKAREKDGDKYCALVVSGLNNCKYETNKCNVLGRNGNPSEIEFKSGSMPSLGDVLYPCFALEADISCESNQKVEFYISIVSSDNLQKLYSMIETCNNPRFSEYAHESAKVKSLSLGRANLESKENYIFALNLASMILFTPYSSQRQKLIYESDVMNLYNKVGLNGQLKTIFFSYENNFEQLKTIIGIIKYLNIGSVQCNLIVDYHESDIYHKLVLNKLLEIVNNVVPSFIRFIEKDELSDNIKNTAFLVLENLELIIKNKKINNKSKTLNYNENISKPILKPAIKMHCGSGGFDEKGDYIINSSCLLPYSNVICGSHGGTIITENGGGYTYLKNSRENKITLWNNEPICDAPSERLYLSEKNLRWRLNKYDENGYVKYGLGFAEFCMDKFGILSNVSQFIIDEGRTKVYEVNISNTTENKREMDLIFSADFCLFWKESDKYLNYEIIDKNILQITNCFSKQRAYIRTINDCNILINSEKLYNYREKDNCGIEIKYILSAQERVKEYILISSDLKNLLEIDAFNIFNKKEESLNYFENLNKIKITTESPKTDILFNKYLMYQVVSSRINGRCGYYQAGGAIGFRDQLQDCMSLLYTDPKAVRAHILNSATHQYIEGDVMHWWHEPALGVRTKISDDKLFLPYVVCDYINKTGDFDILKENLSYLFSPPLEKNQEARMEEGVNSDYKDSLLEHCKRAIKNALAFGENGLLLIGSGDWNDALNDIGMEGRGESVWLSMFAYMVISEFIELLPSDERLPYLTTMDNLYSGIKKSFNGGWYKRAFTDEGKWLGDESSEVCKIDLLTQSFAVLCGACPEENYSSAMKNAEDLIDYDLGIIKLLSPPFDKQHYAGYISAYPKGVRENGGQYTHAAVWYIKALAKIDRSKAFEMVKLINPIVKCSEGLNETYMGEPYVLSGDVYTSGQMGWSWYTGSASWMYKVILEDIIGIVIKNNNLIFNPKYIDGLGNVKVSLTHKNATFVISFSKIGRKNITVDGISYSKDNSIPLFDTNKTYEVTVEY